MSCTAGTWRCGRRRTKEASLSDTEPGEYPPEQILAGELAGDLAQGLLRGAQLLGDQFPGTLLGELAGGLFGVLAGPREGLQVPAAGADRPRLHPLATPALLQIRAHLLQPLAGEPPPGDVGRAGER